MNVIFVNSIEFSREPQDLPLGIMSLATVCNLEKDIHAKIVDFGYLFSNGLLMKSYSLDENIETMCSYLMNLGADIICFYSMCSSYHLNVILSKKIKERSTHTIVFFGGPHASLTAEDSLRAFPWVDYIGVDEGEKTIVPLLHGAISGRVENLLGVAYRAQNGDIIVNRAPICDVNTLPFIDYSIDGIKIGDSVPIDVGRGCPFNCAYCSTKTFWKQCFRLKDIERIVFEIKQIKQQYGVSRFSFVHDLFTVNKQNILKFCEEILEEKISITWSCSARLDTLTDELLEKMSDAGCRDIFLGIETGSSKMQKIINKNLDLNLIDKLIFFVNKYKSIDFTCSFMYGFPMETIDDLKETLDLIRRIWKAGVTSIQLHKVTFLPGTALYEKYNGQLKYDPLCTDFTEQSYINDEAIEFITNNKSIFPQFYTIPSVATQFPFLNYFVIYIYQTIDTYMPFTSSFLSTIIGDDILSLYISFEKSVPDLVQRLSLSGVAYLQKAYDTGLIFNIILEYLSVVLLPRYSYIYEVSKFEIDSIRFVRGEASVLHKHYSFDVLSLMGEGVLKSNSCPKSVDILLEKKDEDIISAKYI